MTYKGYLGSVAYSEKDQVFFGKIEVINGLVNFEGESVKELTEAFHEASMIIWLIVKTKEKSLIRVIQAS